MQIAQTCFTFLVFPAVRAHDLTPGRFQTHMIKNIIYCIHLHEEVFSMASSETTRTFTFSLLVTDTVGTSAGKPAGTQAFFVSEEELISTGGTDAFLREILTGNRIMEPLVLRASVGEKICVRLITPRPAQTDKTSPVIDSPLSFTDENGSMLTPDPVSGSDGDKMHIWYFPARKQPGILFFRNCLPSLTGNQDAFGVLLIEEEQSSFHAVRTGARLRSGTKAVIQRAGKSAFREYVLFIHPIAHPGTLCINYQAEPIDGRLKNHCDPSYAFSSRVHHDPATPILEAYPEDTVVIRIFDLTKNEPSFRLFGMDCHTVSLAAPGFFEVRIPKAGAPGDYLYTLGTTDNAWEGLWGIFRVHPKLKKRLLPLDPADRHTFSRMPVPKKDDVIRRYQIMAIRKRRTDSSGPEWLFVPEKDKNRVMQTGYRPKPMVLSADPGDWIEITLCNLSADPDDISLNLPAKEKYPAYSRRVSLHPEYLSCDPVCASGINVGYNKTEQTVPPGGHITYLWHAGTPGITCRLLPFGDIRLCKTETPGVVIRVRPETNGFLRRLRRYISRAKSRAADSLAPYTHFLKRCRKQ